ncbi:MAG TPA: type I methionyl aminopeptidase [Candidatus Paceibacterota bacterium]|nr:type I methionyl aminopeptidase [Candidatus Paceibacterota bacterium]
MIAKTQEEIEGLRESGRILSGALKEAISLVKVGVSSAELDIAAEKYIRKHGGVPAFLNYQPRGAAYPFPAALCVTINNEVAHGIPREDRFLAEGDIVSLDLGVSYNGYITDAAIACIVGEGDADSKRLLNAARETLSVAVAAMKAGAHAEDAGAAVQVVARKYNVAIVEDLGGHAVGKTVHDKPYIPNVGTKGVGEILPEGMVLALEPHLTLGKGHIVLEDDQWTYSTADDSRAAHFEQTIILTKDGAEVITPF